MQSTPIANRKHIALIGNANSGKSTLFNKLLGQELAIISEKKGTTTDPIIKAMELSPYGPVALIDTAGLNDDTELGIKRMKKTNSILARADLLLYIADIANFDSSSYEEARVNSLKKKTPFILVFTKCDLVDDEVISQFKADFRDATFISMQDVNAIALLKKKIIGELEKITEGNDTIIGNLLDRNSTVILVIPIDIAAPKGRLILPQVQLIRDCLDNDIKCTIVKENQIREVLSELPPVDLVITDSQIFSSVERLVPQQIPLTSFSMLLANKNGGIRTFIDGARAIDELPNGAKILMAEACTHNVTHEDIGREKIPRWLKSFTGKDFKYTYTVSHDFPDDLAEYDLVIHCGGCMINKKAISSRLNTCKKIGVPITNYGVVIAYINGILDRCSTIFY